MEELRLRSLGPNRVEEMEGADQTTPLSSSQKLENTVYEPFVISCSALSLVGYRSARPTVIPFRTSKFRPTLGPNLVDKIQDTGQTTPLSSAQKLENTV